MSVSTGERHEGAHDLRFSVVIPTYQRRDLVVAALRALEAQEDVDGYEVVVVVDGSTDGTTETLRQLTPSFPLTVLEQPNRGRAAAVNHGAEVAHGELLLVLDDDMEADPRLLAEHDRSHREGADVVLGHIPLHPDSPESFLRPGVAAWADRRAKALSSSAAPDLHDLVTGQISLRNDVFRRIGGFDTDFTRDGAFGNEDLELGHRLRQLGQQIVFNERAVSRQRYVVTPAQYLSQWRRGGSGRRHAGAQAPRGGGRPLPSQSNGAPTRSPAVPVAQAGAEAGSPQARRLQGPRAEDGQPLLPSRRPRVFPGSA